MNRILAIAGIAACLSLVTGVRADDKLEGAGAGKSDAAKAERSNMTPDMRFLEEAAKGGMAEVRMSELAAQKAESSSVKQFAERMARDHRDANQKIQQLFTRKGMTQPTQIEREDQRHIDHLNTLSGTEFDKQFIKHAVQHHKKDVKKFEKQGESGEDPAIRSFAREILPTLREHLRMAQMLQDNPNASLPELREPAGAQPDAQQQQDQQGQQDPQATPTPQP